MRQLLITILTPVIMTAYSTSFAQQPDFSTVKTFEHQLDDVMEITDTTELKLKLKEVEEAYAASANEINKTRLGIIYHETALNLSFFSESRHKGYAIKSYEILRAMDNPSTSQGLLPFVASYKASALSLVSAETKKLGLLGEAFKQFNEAERNMERYPTLLNF